MSGVSIDKNDWQAEDDMRTLMRAEEIKADKQRLKAALRKRDEMKQALVNIGGNRGR